MTPIRALFFLAAITAACAGRIPATLVEETDSLETHIALLASHRLTGNPIENGIDRFKELVRKIKERLQQAENELIDALEASSVAVVKKINEFILKRTGVDLKLDEKLEALEKKTEACTSQFKTSLSDIVVEIKTDTETCAAKQLSDTKEIVEKIVALVEILKVVPAKTIADIKACGAAPTTIAPPTEPTPEDPETEAPQTDAPQTESPETDAPETESPASVAPETESPAIPITEDDEEDTTGDSIDDSTDSNVVLRSRHSVRSWSDIWRKAKCVTKELATAAKELAEVPEIISKLVSDIADLSNKESREALEKCAVQTVAGKAPEVQTAAAQLAYCVIAPASKQ